MTIFKIANRLIPFLLALSVSAGTFAQGISPEQIASFSSMSAAEKQRLAKQYGVSLTQVGGSEQKTEELPQTIQRIEQGQRIKYQPEDDAEEGLPLFGYNVFAGQTTSFTPIADLPVPSDYVVGPGDEISIQLYGKENEQHFLVVGRDGYINMPKLGPISVAGKSFQQVREDLRLRIKRQIIGAESAIAMGELRLMQIYVLGDANKPGAYNLSSLATVTQALIAAGGVAETGSLRQIEVRRGTEVVQRVDLYDLLLRGDKSSDIRLQSGDAVFIRPAGNRVSVEGEVVREAIYEINNGTSLGDILRIAGGLKSSALKSNVTIKRATDQGLKVFSRNVSNRSEAAFKMLAGDAVFVQQKAKSYASAITLSGAFTDAGRHGFVAGMRVSDLLQTNVLRDDADKNLALLVSTDKAGYTTARYLPLQVVLDNPAHNDNYLLQENDELIVFPGIGFLRCSADEIYGSEQREVDAQSIENVLQKIKAQHEESLTISQVADEGAKENYLDVAQELLRQQEYSQLEKEKLALKREHCGLRARYNPGLVFNRSADELEEEASTRLEDLEDEALMLINEERKSLLAPLLTKLRLQSKYDEFQQIVEIRGEVKYPGIYPYSEKLDAKTLLAIAGGTMESTYRQQVELTRLSRDQGRLRLVHTNLKLTDQELIEAKLQPRDRVSVFQHPDWRNDLTVKIAGEVLFPGSYAVQRGETIKDVIERAGGLTEYAFPEGAVLSRKSLKEKEAKELQRLRESLKQEVASMALQKSTPTSGLSVSPVEAIRAVDQLSEVEALGRLVIDLPSALASESANNVRLENGDELYIPVHSDTVTIVGEVQYPSSHVFEKGLSYKDYIAKAGGMRERADNDRVYVIRANGEVAVPKNSWFGAEIREGDTVVVPIDAQYTDKLSLFGSVTQILYQLGIAYDVIRD
ncbi:protein involved in polysaccharide export with SLBB domain [Litorivivens lipolytica]|uniref:Protein involved in polysaccharide export with SLBB domain n=1 Tax=Litorivivens lipolytica TaxID=1524264 RepID=A0A7W4W7C6_9GAMM|nr:SLBB domain-containing protein [Litorivivens lipolytica]MBB3048802.1 protein involved in polysaccharide export with SLBB domain [Litorivivens lipolytica]